MASRIQVNVEKTFDRGPQYPYLEVQVSFEEKASSPKDLSLASVIISLPKAKVGGISFDEMRAMALSKAVEFMEDCIKGSGIR